MDTPKKHTEFSSISTPIAELVPLKTLPNVISNFKNENIFNDASQYHFPLEDVCQSCSNCEVLQKKIDKSRSWIKFYREKLVRLQKIVFIVGEYERERHKNLELQMAYDQRSREWTQQQDQLISMLNEIEPLRERLKIAEEAAEKERRRAEEKVVLQESLRQTIQQLQAKVSHLHSIGNPLFVENAVKKLGQVRNENKKLKADMEDKNNELAEHKKFVLEKNLQIENVSKKLYWALHLADSFLNLIPLENRSAVSEESLRRLQTHLELIVDAMDVQFKAFRHSEERRLNGRKVEILCLPTFGEWIDDFDKEKKANEWEANISDVSDMEDDASQLERILNDSTLMDANEFKKENVDNLSKQEMPLMDCVEDEKKNIIDNYSRKGSSAIRSSSSELSRAVNKSSLFGESSESENEENKIPSKIGEGNASTVHKFANKKLKEFEKKVKHENVETVENQRNGGDINSMHPLRRSKRRKSELVNEESTKTSELNKPSLFGESSESENEEEKSLSKIVREISPPACKLTNKKPKESEKKIKHDEIETDKNQMNVGKIDSMQPLRRSKRRKSERLNGESNENSELNDNIGLILGKDVGPSSKSLEEISSKHLSNIKIEKSTQNSQEEEMPIICCTPDEKEYKSKNYSCKSSPDNKRRSSYLSDEAPMPANKISLFGESSDSEVIVSPVKKRVSRIQDAGEKFKLTQEMLNEIERRKKSCLDTSRIIKTENDDYESNSTKRSRRKSERLIKVQKFLTTDIGLKSEIESIIVKREVECSKEAFKKEKNNKYTSLSDEGSNEKIEINLKKEKTDVSSCIEENSIKKPDSISSKQKIPAITNRVRTRSQSKVLAVISNKTSVNSINYEKSKKEGEATQNTPGNVQKSSPDIEIGSLNKEISIPGEESKQNVKQSNVSSFKKHILLDETSYEKEEPSIMFKKLTTLEEGTTIKTLEDIKKEVQINAKLVSPMRKRIRYLLESSDEEDNSILLNRKKKILCKKKRISPIKYEIESEDEVNRTSQLFNTKEFSPDINSQLTYEKLIDRDNNDCEKLRENKLETQNNLKESVSHLQNSIPTILLNGESGERTDITKIEEKIPPAIISDISDDEVIGIKALNILENNDIKCNKNINNSSNPAAEFEQLKEPLMSIQSILRELQDVIPKRVTRFSDSSDEDEIEDCQPEASNTLQETATDNCSLPSDGSDWESDRSLSIVVPEEEFSTNKKVIPQSPEASTWNIQESDEDEKEKNLLRESSAFSEINEKLQDKSLDTESDGNEFLEINSDKSPIISTCPSFTFEKSATSILQMQHIDISDDSLSEQLDDIIHEFLSCKPQMKIWKNLVRCLCDLVPKAHSTALKSSAVCQFIRSIIRKILKSLPIWFMETYDAKSMPICRLLEIVRIVEIHQDYPPFSLHTIIQSSCHKLILGNELQAYTLAALSAWFISSCFIQYNSVEPPDDEAHLQYGRSFLIDLLFHHKGFVHTALLSVVVHNRKSFIRMVKYREWENLERVITWIVFFGTWKGPKMIKDKLKSTWKSFFGCREAPEESTKPIYLDLLKVIHDLTNSKRTNAQTALLLLLQWQEPKTAIDAICACLREFHLSHNLFQEDSEKMNFSGLKTLLEISMKKTHWDENDREKLMRRLTSLKL